jgi:rubrerythrin
MSLAKTFYLLKDVETRIGELYSLISLNTAILQPKLAELFGDLAEEEKVHAREIELLQSLFLESKDPFLENPEIEKLIAEFMQNLDMTRNYVNQHDAEIGPRDLIDLALELEKSLVEKHRLLFMKAGDPQIKKLLENLNLADAGHVRKLIDFQTG